jgi:hypothetical protein
MKKILKNNLYALLLFVIAAGLATLQGCDNEEEAPKEVVLLSMGPSGVEHGDEIVFIGQNMNRVSSIVFTPGVEITDFIEKTKERITVAVPDAAEAGKVILKTPEGDIESKTILNFKVPVTISSITGEARPGATITITGDKLNWIEEITFPADLVLEKKDFVSQSLTQLVVTVPMEAQSGFLLFETGGTDPLSFGSENQLTVTLPKVTSLSPNPVKHTANLTITGTDLDLVTSIDFGGNYNLAKANFVSQSATEIVVAVPAGTTKGKLTLNQSSPVDVITASELSIVLPAGTSITPSPATPGVDNITITGTDLDLVASLALTGVTSPIASAAFVSKSATQIVLALPATAKSGSVSYTTIHGYSALLGVNVIIPAPGPKPLAITMYDESIGFGGGNWSWGGTVVTLSTEQFYSGTKSFKHTTSGSDGGASVGGMTGVNASAQGVFKFSLYGGAGTNGKQVAAVLGSDGADKWDSYNSVTLVEGQWTEYSIPLSSYPTVNLSNVTRWIFKVEGATNAVLYVDRVGFDPAGPPPLDYYIYKDGLMNSWSEWGGWGHTTKDFNNSEEVFSGTKAIKMTFNDQYGAMQIGSPSTTAFNGYTTLSFRIYAPAAQNLIVQIGSASDKYLSISQGWNLVDIPLSGLAGSTNVTELRIKNNNANLPVTLYIDEIGLKL